MFHAVMTGILPMVTRRLDTEERRAVRAGNVYVWEERGRNAEATGVRLFSSLVHRQSVVLTFSPAGHREVDRRHTLERVESERCMFLPSSSRKALGSFCAQEFLLYHERDTTIDLEYNEIDG